MAKLARLDVGGTEVHLLGTVQGFAPDGEEVRRLLAQVQPAAVGLGVPPEDMEALRVLADAQHPETLIGAAPPKLSRAATPAGGAPGLEAMFQTGQRDAGSDADDAPFASLDPVQEHFLGLLARFGAVHLPSPDLDAAFSWAKQHDVRIEALDLDDEAHAESYIRANRFRDVLRSGRIQKKLLKASFDDAGSSDELAIAWDAFQNQLPSLQKVEQAREKEMAQRIGQLPGQTVVAVVPVARWDGVRQRLEDAEALAAAALGGQALQGEARDSA